MDQFDKSVEKDGADYGIKIYHINEVIEEGRKHPNLDLTPFMPSFDST